MRILAILLTAAVVIATGCDLKLRRRPAPATPAAPPAPTRPTAEAVEAAAWEEMEARSAALVASQQFGGALRFLDSAAAHHPARVERIRSLKEAVMAAALARADELDRVAREAIERGDEAAAQAAWKAALELDVNEVSDRIRTSIQAGEAILFRKQRARAWPKLGPVLLELQKYLLARDDKASLDFLTRTNAAHPDLLQEIDWLRGTVIEAGGVYKAVECGLNLLKDSEVTLGAEGATVVGATAETASFRRPAGDMLALPLAQLPPDLFLKAALRGGHSADFVGQYFLFTGRVAEARAAFKGLNRQDLDTLADSVERAIAGSDK
ncbi:MAG: hypothetical protein AAB074_21005 [Planctomycetota bacterium]